MFLSSAEGVLDGISVKDMRSVNSNTFFPNLREFLNSNLMWSWQHVCDSVVIQLRGLLLHTVCTVASCYG